MSIKRLTLGLFAAAALAATPIVAQAKSFILYAGSYTAGTSKGIYAWRFDSDTGAMTPIGLVAEAPQPAHLWIGPNRNFLYSVNWERAGGVSAFRIDPKSGKLSLLNRVSSAGVNPNQVVLDPSGRIAVTVNYGTGTIAAYRVLPDGKLSEAFYTEQYAGPPLSPKMTGPHSHGIQFSKDGRFMWIAELGLDRVYSYRVDPAKATITPADPAFISTHGGAGPRRLQLSPNGKFLYVNHETDAEVSLFAVDGAKLTEVQKAPTLLEPFAGTNMTAEMVLDAKGRHLYVGNRGHDSIAVFDADPQTGQLTLKANVPAGGRTPRNLRIDPTGQWLLSANENGGAIVVFKIDPATGGLTATSHSGAIDTPGGMFFLQ